MKNTYFYSIVSVATIIIAQILLVFSATAAPLYQNLPQAKSPYTAIVLDIEHEGLSIELRRVDFWDGYMVFVGIATTTNSSDCLFRGDFILQLGDISYEAASRDTTREAYAIDAPGTGFFGLCLSQGESEIVLLPFFAPVNSNKAQVVYKDQAFSLSTSLTELNQSGADPLPTSTPTFTPTSTPTLTPTPTFTPASANLINEGASTFSLPLPSNASSIFRSGEVSNNGIKFSLERIDFWKTLPDGTNPNNEVFVVFTGVLSPLVTETDTHCVGGEDVELYVGNLIYQTDNMRSANRFYQADYPGYLLSQCVDSESKPTFFIFDVKLTPDTVYLVLHGARLQLDKSLYQLQPEGLSNSNSASTSDRPLTPTATLAPASNSVMVSAIANKNANLREGPSTEYKIIGKVTTGQELKVIGKNDDGTWYLLDTEAWIAAFLVSPASDPSILSQLPIISTSNAKDTKLIPTSTPEFYIGDLTTLISEPIDVVEAKLGKSSMITPFDAGDMSGYTGNGETRGYSWNGYSFLGYYDTSGVLKGIQVESGLDSKGYKIGEWQTVITGVGLPDNILPDITAPAAVRWDNLNGYKVAIIADGVRATSVIWTVQIWSTK